ncbi:Uncharacterised protein [Zhongshania aliphaticivorans]|uniref:DUF423 domain-containing protein n=1 Tax=Zhongshania aliphaticivorans TaxID=1470434 RepID=A0A5S9MV80_9GAMM|nr:DUF423 domain-containing protein [Zhongshania aliphaticivorans]CAA0080198.1 Uncharacterised protein [Zhongshania aliphaticivorans]CAA0085835.1 Uncharacterised protein [Zhongshania aliphaticivorans]
MAALTLFTASILAFLAVALGAFGAHGLKASLPADMMAVYQTAVQYHFYHCFALLAVGLLMHSGVQHLSLRISAVMFFMGVLVFSGSLYILAITGVRWLGAITPIGGLMFLVAWACLAYSAWKAM